MSVARSEELEKKMNQEKTDMMKRISITFLFVVLPLLGLSAQSKGVKEIVIQTSAQCEMCKDRMEKEMAFTKGVNYANLDLETKKLTVRYKEKKTNAEQIRKAIAAVGYDADEVPADPEAYDKLPACCKKGGHD